MIEVVDCNSWFHIKISNLLRYNYIQHLNTELFQSLVYRIEYSPDAEEHLMYLTARQQSIVLDAVDEQLMYQPNIETKNRKLMRPNPLAIWELRIGELRVYYDVEEEPEALVYINAIGVKERNIVRIAGEIFEL